MQIDQERLIHSLKTAIACVVAFFAAKLVHLPGDQWIVITVIVVMCAQIYVGSVLQKAYLRFLGTLFGCLLAAATLAAFGASDTAIIITIAFAGFVFSYFATGQDSLGNAGTLGAVTTTIILLGDNPTVLFAGERFIEISLGILIATLISQFILPIHARTHLRHAQVTTLQQLLNYYTNTMVKNGTNHYQDEDESIVKTILLQRQLAKESIREPLLEKFDTDHFMQTLYCEREMLRTITFMHKAFANTHVSNPALDAFNTSVIASLNTFVTVITSPDTKTASIVLPDLAALTESRIAVNGFLFLAETLTNCITTLAKLYDIPVHQCGFSKLSTPEL